jgi:hemolysin activation/secretion protein
MDLGSFAIAQATQAAEQVLIRKTSAESDIALPKTQECKEHQSADKEGSSATQSGNLKPFTLKNSSLQPRDIDVIYQEIKRNEQAISIEERIAVSITKQYLSKGYVLSGVPLALAKAGELEPIEACLRNITFTSPSGDEREHPLASPLEKYLFDRIQRNISAPLNWNTLEDNLTLLKSDPLVKAETFRADLFKGDNTYPEELISHTADLKITYEPASRFYTGFSSDNYLSSSIGSIRATSLMGFRNLVGIGDNLALFYSRSSTGGAQSYDISYQRILNPLNGTLQFRVAPNSYRITEAPYKSFGIRGTSTLYEVNLRQPIIRSLRKELAFSLGFSAQTGQSFFSNTIPLSNTDTKTLKFGQDYRTQNSSGGWQLGSQFNFGFQTNQNKSSFSWQGQLERQQKITDNYSISAQLNLQLTPQNLATSQEFFLGGAQSLRGYRTNALSGDNGLRFALENRISLAKNNTFVVVPFLDLGYAWNQPTSAKAAPLTNQKFLASAGLGLIWQPSRNMGLRLDYGIPLSQGSVNGINLRDPSLSRSQIH